MAPSNSSKNFCAEILKRLNWRIVWMSTVERSVQILCSLYGFAIHSFVRSFPHTHTHHAEWFFKVFFCVTYTNHIAWNDIILFKNFDWKYRISMHWCVSFFYVIEIGSYAHSQVAVIALHEKCIEILAFSSIHSDISFTQNFFFFLLSIILFVFIIIRPGSLASIHFMLHTKYYYSSTMNHVQFYVCLYLVIKMK